MKKQRRSTVLFTAVLGAKKLRQKPPPRQRHGSDAVYHAMQKRQLREERRRLSQVAPRLSQMRERVTARNKPGYIWLSALCLGSGPLNSNGSLAVSREIRLDLWRDIKQIPNTHAFVVADGQELYISCIGHWCGRL